MALPELPVTLEQVRAALARPLPGLPVQMRMAPRPQSRPGSEHILDPDLNCRWAAVLALVYPCDGELCLVLTRRTESLASHRGQIALPGGSREDGEDDVRTALREAQEELGIDPASVEILGQLSRLYIPASNFCMRPVVGYAPRRPVFEPSPDEVAEVIEEPLAHLLDARIRLAETWQLRGQPVQVPFYRIGSHKVWGATAMVLCELIALLAEDGETGR
jgi:8-oxo-dGTP pyrophosphatase MutT (NUDIX family)